MCKGIAKRIALVLLPLMRSCLSILYFKIVHHRSEKSALSNEMRLKNVEEPLACKVIFYDNVLKTISMINICVSTTM